MEFRIDLPHTPDLARVAQLLCDDDPSAVFDLAPGTSGLRLSTVLNADDVHDLFERAGQPLQSSQLRAVPSVCCGGCGG
jgi:hypothetical protein